MKVAMKNTSKETLDRMDWVLDLFPDLKKFWKKNGGHLSGGQKQMLSIARAYINENDLLLIDEPSKGLAPIVVEKEDIRQISVTKNRDHSLRWLIRSFYVIFLPLYLGEGIIKALRNLERSFPDYIVFSLFLVRLAGVAIFLALFYNFELLAPYQQTLKVTTNSNLNLQFYTEKPKELVAILKNEAK